jgi:glycosyltransferase involved in cell wall biosynthesis
MRILHVAESVKGGCGTYLNQVMRVQMASAAIESVHAVLPQAHLVQVPDIPERRRTLFPGGSRSPQALRELWRATAQAVKAFEPDCVHLHSTFAGAIGRLGLALHRRDRPSVVYCAHGWAFDMAGSAIKRAAMVLAERALAPACEGIIAISEYERQRAIAAGIAPQRIVTVLNGIVDVPPPPSPQPGRTRRVLFIGRLDRQKGFDILLDAVAPLAARIDLRVIGSSVVGDQTALGAKLPGGTMLGWCDEAKIRDELAWADCVVVPSRWEGFGLVALEAMRAGRAVIASRVGGLPEVVEHGHTGWLIPPDDPVALREALITISDADLITAGAAGRRRFLRHFTIERTAASLIAVYRQAIAMRSNISHALHLMGPTVEAARSG